MQSLLRQASAAARCLAGAAPSGTRTFKDLPAHKNPYVEAWYDAREDMEMRAKITAPMLLSGFVWGLLVPYALFEAILAEQRESAKVTGQRLVFIPDAVGYGDTLAAAPADSEEDE